MAVVLVLVTTGGCGGDGEEAPTTTVSTEPTTTRLPQGDAKGIACANLSTLELKLLNDYREEARGVVAPDDEAYRAEADVLRAEHIRLAPEGLPHDEPQSSDAHHPDEPAPRLRMTTGGAGMRVAPGAVGAPPGQAR